MEVLAQTYLTLKNEIKAIMATRREEAESVPWKVTRYVVVCWTIVACSGLMFGYDIGVSGGVTLRDDLLMELFPRAYKRKQDFHENNYCKFDAQRLQLFKSCTYLSAIIASFIASKVCSLYGRRLTIYAASVFFFLGTGMCALAHLLGVLLLGRVLIGFGVGFGNEVVPLFLSETAPVQHRGAVNVMFQLSVTIGILAANIANFATTNVHPIGWRISMGVSIVPAIVLWIGSFVITETPTSLIQLENFDQGKKALQKFRGVDGVDAELEQIQEACHQAKEVEHPFKVVVMKKSSIPPMVVGILMQVFQQMTGINAFMLYAPVLFQAIGFNSQVSLLLAVIIGLVNVLGTLVSVYYVDKLGRRALLLQACVQMFISQFAIGIILIVQLGDTNSLPKGSAIMVVVLICTFVMSFAWSWGPLGWLIPSETFPVGTRNPGFSFAVSSNMLFTFIIGRTFLSMWCHMRAYVFIFFSVWIVLMTLFVIYLLPETKGVPIDLMVERVWKKHPIWQRYMEDSECDTQA